MRAILIDAEARIVSEVQTEDEGLKSDYELLGCDRIDGVTIDGDIKVFHSRSLYRRRRPPQGRRRTGKERPEGPWLFPDTDEQRLDPTAAGQGHRAWLR